MRSVIYQNRVETPRAPQAKAPIAIGGDFQNFMPPRRRGVVAPWCERPGLPTVAAVAAGAVSSVFGRTGDVAALLGDYPASKIGNDTTFPGANLRAVVEGMAAGTVADARGVTYVNSFYKTGDGPSGGTQPLSATYGSLAAAQADYPQATSLLDEKDWCAWMAAALAAYTNGSARIWAQGNYLVSKPVPWNGFAILIEGVHPNQRYGGTSVTYNGAGGTIDAPTCIFDFYTFDEAGQAAPGRAFNAAIPGPKVILKNIRFFGKNQNLSTTVQATGHDFVWGVRVRQASFFQMDNCSFDGGLYDGLVFTAPQLFVTIDHNWFGAIARDGIVNFNTSPQPGGNSTTFWVYNNEFVGCDRYAIMLDFSGGAVQSMPIIRDNSFETNNNAAFYATHPEWFMHGVAATTCFISCTNMLFQANRFEHGNETRYWADVHLVEPDAVTVENCAMANLFITTNSVAAPRTSAAITFVAANKWQDVTDQRNYNVGSTGDMGAPASNCVIRHNYNMGAIFGADLDITGPFGSTGFSVIEDNPATVYGIPTYAGTYARLVTPRPTAPPILADYFYETRLRNAAQVSLSGIKFFDHFDFSTQSGAYKVRKSFWSTWAQSHAYLTTIYGSNIYGVAPFLVPTVENGFFYQITAGGTSGTVEPTWPTTIGSSVTKDGVTYKCVGRVYLAADDNVSEWMEDGKRRRSGTAAPTTGAWGVGDKVYATDPYSVGFEGWVCKDAGTPGNWKRFGAVEA